MGDFWHGQVQATEGDGSAWSGLGRAFLSSTVDAAVLGRSNPGGLTFSSIFQLDFCQPEEYTGHHAAQRAAQINLLGHHYNPHVTLTPVRKERDAFMLPTREPVRVLPTGTRESRLSMVYSHPE